MSASHPDEAPVYPARWAESDSIKLSDLALPLQIHVSRAQGRIVGFLGSSIAFVFLMGGAAMLVMNESTADRMTAGAAIILSAFFLMRALSLFRRSELGLLYTIDRCGLTDHRQQDAVLWWAEVESVDFVRNQYAIVGVWFTVKGAPGTVPWWTRNFGWLLPGDWALRLRTCKGAWRYINLAGLRLDSGLIAELILKLVRQENTGVKLERNLVEGLLGGGPRLT